MMLLTQDQRKRLIANGQNSGDHVPIVKLFNPLGAATWLLSELDSDAARLVGRITEDETRLKAAALPIHPVKARQTLAQQFCCAVTRPCFHPHIWVQAGPIT